MTDTIKVKITAREVVRYERVLEIPKAKFAEYEAMCERHQETCVRDSEWERAFGDYLIGVCEPDRDGLTDLEIEKVKR